MAVYLRMFSIVPAVKHKTSGGRCNLMCSRSCSSNKPPVSAISVQYYTIKIYLKILFLLVIIIKLQIFVMERKS